PHFDRAELRLAAGGGPGARAAGAGGSGLEAGERTDRGAPGSSRSVTLASRAGASAGIGVSDRFADQRRDRATEHRAGAVLQSADRPDRNRTGGAADHSGLGDRSGGIRDQRRPTILLLSADPGRFRSGDRCGAGGPARRQHPQRDGETAGGTAAYAWSI